MRRRLQDGRFARARSHECVTQYRDATSWKSSWLLHHSQLLTAYPLVLAGYLDTVRSTQPANSRWKILVVDAFTKLHLNHVLKVYDILEEGVQRALTLLFALIEALVALPRQTYCPA